MPISALGVPTAMLLLAGAGAPEPVLHSHPGGLGCDHCAAMKASLVTQAPLMPRDADRAATDTDVLHYFLDISIIPSTTSIAGTNTISVRAQVDGVQDFDIDLSNTFTIPAITMGGLPVSWVRLSPSLIRVTLDRAYDTGEEFEIQVSYSGPASGGGFGSITWATSGGQPFVYTLSQPYFAYTWWPSKDVSADKATADLRFTVPGNLKVASNGVLLSDTLNPDTTRTFHYRTNYPTSPYLYCFGLGNYNFFSSSYTHAQGTTPLEFAVLVNSDTPSVRAAWLKLGDMLPVFDEIFGLYPFWEEKCGIYQFGFGGGMEHQTMSGQGTTNESVTAHEAGHMWWGDLVTCETWNHIWVNEGFATYSEALWEERKGGSPNATALKNAMAARKPSNFTNSSYVPTTTSVNRIFDSNSTYRKGGWIMHMLRRRVGDTVFFDALADYRADHEFGTVVTEDVQAAFENASGQDLSSFFAQWVYQPGAPTIRHALRPVAVNGQNYAEIYLAQTQSGSWPTYETDIDIRVSTAGGGVDITVPMWTRGQHYLVPLAHAPNALTIDPNGWLLMTSASTITFAEGPARVVETVPVPGAALAFGSLSAIEVQFHKDVAISVSDVFLAGQATGPVPVSLSYDGPNRRATVTPLAVLAGDTYTMTISDTVEDVAAGLSLDGEIVGGAFPSGDGLAGGSAVFQFVVSPAPCPGDVNGDFETNSLDFNILAGNFGATVPAGTLGDLNGDGEVNSLDFNILASDFGCGG